MCDGTDLSMIAPVKEAAIRVAQRQATTIDEYHEIRQLADAFNRDLGSLRCKVEQIIGDLTRWAYARGSPSRTWHCGIANHKMRIKLCMFLTNFVYHERRRE